MLVYMNSLPFKIVGIILFVHLFGFFIAYILPLISTNTTAREDDIQDSPSTNPEEIDPLLGDLDSSSEELDNEIHSNSKKPDHILLSIDENYIHNTETSINKSSK